VAPVASTAALVTQRIIHIETGRKRALLAKLLQGEGVGRTLVFARTKHGADRVVKQLEQDGLSANAIHGNKSQGQRERALQEFRDGVAPILVATDIAARGIDVDNVTHVIQYDLPDVPESYVHRIGRTARAGASGEAVALVAADELDKLWAVEKLVRTPIPAEDHRQDQSIPVARAPANGKSASRPQQRGGGQGRGRGAPGGPARSGGAPRPQGNRPAGPPRGPDAGQSRRRAMPAAIAEVGRKDRRWRDADFREGASAPAERDRTWRVGGDD
jgi:ATP-dependent RNA helicase RhlE